MVHRRERMMQSTAVVPVRREFIKLFVCLTAVLLPLATGAGTFESSLNASTFPRIYNASESGNEDWLGYSCASIGGKANTAVASTSLECRCTNKRTAEDSEP